MKNARAMEYSGHPMALVPGSQASAARYMKNPAADDAFGSQLYKAGAGKDGAGLAKPDGSLSMADPQNLSASGAIAQDKDMKGGPSDNQAADMAEKLVDAADEAILGKEQPQSAMPATGTGATASAAAE